MLTTLPRQHLFGLFVFGLLGFNSRLQAQHAPDSVYRYVEQMPMYGKNPGAVMSYLGTNIRYPVTALQARVEGKVFVGFTVGVDGRLEDIKVVKGAHPDLNAEALRVVSAMQSWEPGRQMGKPVRVAFTLPVTFRLGTTTKAPAQFAGTPEELYGFLNNPPYPEEARNAGATGRVAVVFNVSAAGQVSEVKVLPPVPAELQRKRHQKPQSPQLHPALVAAAEQRIATMPTWKPALAGEQAVSSRLMLSVAYRLPAATDTVYSVVDQMPEFPGGVEQMLLTIRSTTQYPKQARKDQSEGEVLLYFVVNEQGQVEQAEVVRSVHPALDAEALRLVQALPAFTPAMHHGRPAKVGFLFPLPFVLPL
ncbi:TonB family protein [Hymenobacter elongatus]|uniref:TonB family protein n=1 Tax=Hymenobacter elongatus TaxID=877208 RepID=A0A4Z0PFQ4_9BACT|nr:TonB family protein [Hymenobacter elongatus]TGE13081.1 TonB family protein [Hymenobacter elongatus]